MPSSTAEITILYWRDIPAQVLVGRGRQAAKQVLPARFEQAIDRCAMQIGAKDSEAYLAEWRKEILPAQDGPPAEIAAKIATSLDEAHPPEVLLALIRAGGRSTAPR